MVAQKIAKIDECTASPASVIFPMQDPPDLEAITRPEREEFKARQSFRASLAQVVALATEKLPESAARIARAEALVLAGDVEILPDHSALVNSQNSSSTHYHVSPGQPCTCRDAEKAPGGLCKHKLSRALSIRAAEVLLDMPPSTLEPALEPETPPVTAQAVEIPREYVTTIQGRPFIRFAGLLQLGYARGLQRLETTFISVTSELALAQCTATFADGRVVTDVADSTPGNVGSTVRLHWPRLAATRAAARALRNALALDMCSLEELAE